MVDVQCRIGIRLHQPFLPPVAEEARCASVLVALLAVPGLFAIELEANEIRRMPLVKLVLELRRNNIVRGRDDFRERTNVPEIVTEAAESLNRGHDTLREQREHLAAAC